MTENQQAMRTATGKIELHLKQTQADLTGIDIRLRILLGVIIATTLGLASLMAKGFGWI